MVHSYWKYLKFILLYFICSIFPKHKKRFLFISMGGNSFGGNPKALSEYISQTDKGCDIIWAHSNLFDIKSPIGKKVELFTWKYYYYLLTSKVIVSDQRLYKSMLPLKRKGQFYIQLWHGTALKKIEADMPNISDQYIKMAQRDSRMIDLFVSGSSFMSNIYKSSFWYDGNFLEVGTPRNDVFFKNDNNAISDKIKKYYDIGNKKILLYAPTFRASDSLSAYTIEVSRIYEILSKEQWTIMVRLHPNLMGSLSSKTFNKKFPDTIDASSYPDIQELLYATDLLISDYSSCMFDYIYTNRPCVIYASDIEEYDRGFYMPIRSLPFPIAENNDELESILRDLNHENYSSFLEEIGSYECGNASQLIYEYLKKNVL